MSTSSPFLARPLRRVRAPQLLALLRTFDDALADIDDEDAADTRACNVRVA